LTIQASQVVNGSSSTRNLAFWYLDHWHVGSIVNHPTKLLSLGRWDRLDRLADEAEIDTMVHERRKSSSSLFSCCRVYQEVVHHIENQCGWETFLIDLDPTMADAFGVSLSIEIISPTVFGYNSVK
jgi:hypothetical protein